MLKCGYGQIDKQANEQTDIRVKIVTYVHMLEVCLPTIANMMNDAPMITSLRRE